MNASPLVPSPVYQQIDFLQYYPHFCATKAPFAPYEVRSLYRWHHTYILGHSIDRFILQRPNKVQITITKDEDEYYFINYYRYVSPSVPTYYRCDQWVGLEQCLALLSQKICIFEI